MKAIHTALFLLLVSVSVPAVAQHKDGGEKRQRDISELVGDLSQQQKRRLDAITDDSRERVSVLRARQKAVRDSIAMYMEMDGDQSARLYPLFDREAALQRDISREMYAAKVRVDEVLTPAQRQQLRTASRKRAAARKR